MRLSEIIRPQGGPKRDFDLVLDHVKKLHNDLMAMTPVTRDNLGYCDFAGVYLFTEGDVHVYVGRSRRLRARILEHSRPCNPDAALAFFLARKILGHQKASYRSPGSRRDLIKQPEFKAKYEEAKALISKMLIRYVRADDATTQALLEIYTSTKLDTFNEFRTS
jgi:hypothetical protein